MRKNFVLILTLFLIMVVLTGCSAVQSTLGVPEKVRIDDGILRWNSVSGTDKYAIFIDDDEVAIISGTSYELSSAGLIVGKTYKIAVMAKGDGYIKLDSQLSIDIEYTHVNQAQNDNGAFNPPDKVDEVTNTDLANMLFESGLGYGVNALTDKKAVGGVRLTEFFDKSLFTTDNIGSYNIGSSRAKATAEENIRDEVVGINSKLVYGNATQASLSGMFTAGFEEKFSLTSAVESQNHIYQYYFIMNHYIVGKNYQIKNYQQTKAYSDKLSQYAKEDIIALREGSKSAEEFFRDYGTHLTMAVSYGGMAEVYYATFSQNKIDSSEITTQLETSLNAGFAYSGNGADSSVGLDVGLDTKYNINKTSRTSKLYIASVGKNPLCSLTFDSFSKSYPNWVEQMADESNYRIVDVADKGLVPIWKYFPEEYSDVAQKLSNYFENAATARGNELATKMTSPYRETAKTVTMNLIPRNCVDNGGYNPQNSEKNTITINEINSNLFQLIINGTSQNNGKYSLINDLSMNLKLIQDPNSIEITNYPGSDAISASINDDSSSSVKDTTINSKIRKGAVFASITYTDGTTEQGSATNICDGKGKDSCIDILSVTGLKVNNDKTIDSIKIITAYEISTKLNSWYSWGGVFKTYTNWRTENVLKFQ